MPTLIVRDDVLFDVAFDFAIEAHVSPLTAQTFAQEVHDHYVGEDTGPGEIDLAFELDCFFAQADEED